MPVNAPEAPIAEPNIATPMEPVKQVDGHPEPIKTPSTHIDQRTTILGSTSKMEGGPKEPLASTPTAAPDKYADFKLPEGITADPKLMETFTATAKELNLSQSAAQKLVDLQAQNVKAEIDQRLAAFNNQVETWEKESRALYGVNADKQFGIAARAMEQIGTPELRTLLNDAGLGSHPEVIKFFVKAGGMLTEDQPVDGKRAGGEAVSTADLMYPTMKKK